MRDPEGYLFHVGADTTDDDTLGISNPLVGDSFELLPIVEIDERSREKRTFRELPCRNTECGEGLSHYLPDGFSLDEKPHLDPDLDNYSYGEPLTYKTKHGKSRANGKASAIIEDLKPNDYLFFAASLAPFPEGANRLSRYAINKFQSQDRGKYVVAYFSIKGIFAVNEHRQIKSIAGSNEADCRRQLNENAHSKRSPENFVCAVGVERKRCALLKYPIRITNPRSYELNALGLDLVRRCYSGRTYFRGARYLDAKAVKRLLDEIKEMHP